MNSRPRSTITVQIVLVRTPRLAASLRVTTVVSDDSPWWDIDSTRRPRCVRWSAGRDRSRAAKTPTTATVAEPQIAKVRRRCAGRARWSPVTPMAGTNARTPPTSLPQIGDAVDDDGEGQHAERGGHRDPAAGQAAHEQAGQQERGAGELAVGEVAHPCEAPPTGR